MDTIFLTTLLFIFLSAFFGSYLSTRRRDRCLRDFNDFLITFEEKDGDIARGIFVLYFTAFELKYLHPHKNSDGYSETSYIIYKGQYDTIQGIYRYYDELSEQKKLLRNRNIQKSYHPNLWRRWMRNMRNALNTFKQAIFQVIHTALGQAQRVRPSSTFLKSHNKQITDLGEDFISIAANAHEPILERYIGKKVVLEVLKNNQPIKYQGILKEYTDQFIELLDIHELETFQFEINLSEPFEKEQADINISRTKTGIQIKNNRPDSIFLSRVLSKSASRIYNQLIESNTVFELTLPPQIDDEMTLYILNKRLMDAIFPRAHALIRHGGE